jgi:undecaprenyl pyrophosphate phosphatase UppP
MKALPKALGLGILVWLIPFVVAFLVFPFRDSWRALFESVMAVAVSAVAVGFGLIYLRKLPSAGTKDGLLVGVLWWTM